MSYNNYNGGGQPPYYRYGRQPGDPYGPPPPPQKNPYRRPIRRNANIVAGGLILLNIVMFYTARLLSVFVQVTIPAWLRVEVHGVLIQVISLTAYLVGFLVPMIVMVAWIGIPVAVAFPRRTDSLRLLPPAVFLGLGVSFCGSMLAAIVSEMMEQGLGIAPILPELSEPRGVFATVLYFVSAAVAPAILEEMLFRGVIMQSLRRFGDGFALVVSSILFAFCHGNLVQGIFSLLMGLVMGYFVLRTGSLYPGMAIHFANNALAVVRTLGLRNASEETLVVAGLLVLLVYVGGGIIALVHLIRRYPAMFRVAPSQYPLSEGQKHLCFHTSLFPIIYLIMTIVITAQYLRFV